MLLRKYLSHEETENGWILHGDAADVKLIFMSDDVVRICVSFDRSFREESYTLVTTAWEDRMDELLKKERMRIEAERIPCADSEESLEFVTRTMTLCVRKEPFSFSLRDAEGKCFYSDLAERAFERDQLGRLSHYSRMDAEKYHFYGFGEKTGYLDKKGRRLRMSPKDAIGHDPETGDPMYKHIPFYIRVSESDLHAVGLFYHNSYDCVFDMGQEISGYWNRYCYYQTDGGNIDLFLINGPSVKDIIGRYTWLTGRTVLPAKQSLGYGASSMYYSELEERCDEEIFRVAEKHKKEQIGIDNFWLSSGYSSGEEDNLRYTFHWNRKRFPDPEGFFEKMESMGIRVIPNLKPGVLKDHPFAGYYEEHDAFIKTPDGKSDYVGRWWGGEGRFIDFTGPAGRSAWKELLKENILKKGARSLWNDNCELDGIEDRDAKCDFEGEGGTMAELKILHSNLMAYTAVQALSEVFPGERPHIVSRAGFAGIQRYAQLWGGDNLTDWRTVKYNIDTILGMGLSGCANMGCDIGGFAGGAPEEELLLRWIQNGIFQPRFTINSANSDNTVTQPWMYEEDLQYVRQAFALRYRMLPYLYSLMYEASVSGVPALRPLFLEFPEDTNCYNDRNSTFMFGPSVLVANVVEKGAAERTLYLPAGTVWYDMGDHLKQYEGGQTVTVPVDRVSIPMFLRGSAVFLTSDDIKHIAADTLRTLQILVAAEGDCEFTFYDDDGHTEDYKKNDYAAVKISVCSGDRKVISFKQEGSYQSTVEKLFLKVVSKDKGAFRVTVDGEQIPRFIVRDHFDEAEEGWYYDLSDRTIWVKCARPDKNDFEIVVSTEKFDLIGMVEDE